MEALEIAHLGIFRLSQARGYQIPGYLIVDTTETVERFSDIPVGERANLISVLQAAEDLLEKLLGADRVYILRFGEEIRSLHFHVVPRTRAIATRCGQASEPLNGARVVEWIWANHTGLGYSTMDVEKFVAQARDIVMFCD